MFKLVVKDDRFGGLGFDLIAIQFEKAESPGPFTWAGATSRKTLARAPTGLFIRPTRRLGRRWKDESGSFAVRSEVRVPLR